MQIEVNGSFAFKGILSRIMCWGCGGGWVDNKTAFDGKE